jgi:hypothetical protein
MDPGSHVGFEISTKNTNLVEDHPMNISGKFSSILFQAYNTSFQNWFFTLSITCSIYPLPPHDSLFISIDDTKIFCHLQLLKKSLLNHVDFKAKIKECIFLLHDILFSSPYPEWFNRGVKFVNDFVNDDFV